MNLGFFVPTNGGTPANTEIFNFLNEDVKSGKLKDASVFYLETEFNPVQCKFGFFDAADIWNFAGNLICTSLDTLKKAIRTVNKITPAYLFTASEATDTNLFELIAAANVTNAKIIVKNELDYHVFKRLTGIDPVLIEKWSVEELERVFNE